MNKILLKNELEQLLLTNWTQILDRVQLMKTVLEHACNSEFRKIEQEEIPQRHTKIVVTKFSPNNNNFSVWIEFSVPRENGVVIGSQVYSLSLSGELTLQENFGTFFVLK